MPAPHGAVHQFLAPGDADIPAVVTKDDEQQQRDHLRQHRHVNRAYNQAQQECKQQTEHNAQRAEENIQRGHLGESAFQILKKAVNPVYDLWRDNIKYDSK